MKHSQPVEDLLLKVADPIFALKQNGKTFFVAKSFNSLEQNNKENYEISAYSPALPLENLGDKQFKHRYNLKYAYIAGAMANGIASEKMVINMAKSGMIGFFGAGGLSIPAIEKSILTIQSAIDLPNYGFNLIHSLQDPAHEMATVNLYLKHKVNIISAAAFMRMTLPLVLYRVKGIYKDSKGDTIAPNKIIAKVSRIEIARQFFSPPPLKLINKLLEEDLITTQEADLSQDIPMAQDLTAEADSGGHTDNRPAITMLPTMINLKNEFNKKYNYNKPLCVGLAGGIATPESAAAAFQMGAAYILTGSVNQSCVEAQISQDVRILLSQAQQADVAMAPAADMFEIGAKVQVLKRGTMFAVRAEKLYNYYKSYNSFDEIPAKNRTEIEEKFLLSSFEEKWIETKTFFEGRNNFQEIERALNDPKHKMALVFRAYLGLSSKWAIKGEQDRKMDYQIWCGPAIGAFNQWVKGSFLESHENRNVVDIAFNLLYGASVYTRAAFLKVQEIDLANDSFSLKPLRKEEIFKHL